MLIERDQELETLHRALAQVSDTGGKVVLVNGEAGIGKTSLIQTFLKVKPDDVNTAFGLCDPLSTPRPLGPVRDIAHSILGSLSDDDTSFPVGLVEALMEAKCRHIVILEDMHWSDQASLDWLKYFCRRISMLPVMLVITFRDTEADATHPLRSVLGVIPNDRVQRLQLSPLSPDGVGLLELPPNTTAEKLHEITGGNPFFVSEILNNSGDTGVVPQSIRDAVDAGLNQLPTGLLEVLQTAACFPGSISSDFLERILGRPLQDELVAAEKLHMIVARDGGYRFRHELARLATQMRLSETEKRTIHEQLLNVLLAQNDTSFLLADIVHHAQGAHDGETLLRFAPLAAKDAARIGSHREAAQYLFAAMQHAEKAEPRVAAEIYETWAYEAGLALTIDDDVIKAREHAVTLWKELGQSDRVGENLRWLSRLHWYRGEPEKAQVYLEEAIEILQKSPSEATAMAYCLRSQFHMLRDEMEAAQDWGKKALNIAEKVGAEEAKTHALNTIGTAKLFRGDKSGEEALRESLALSLKHGFHEQAARVYTNLSECLIELGEIGKAEPLLDEGIAFDMAHDLDAWTYYLVGRKAQLRFEQDRYLETVDIANGVLSRKNQTVLMQLPAKIFLARSLLRLADPKARDCLNEAWKDALQVGELQYSAVIRTAFIEAAVLWAEPEFAHSHIEEMIALPPASLSPRKWAEFFFWARRLRDDLIKENMPLLSGPYELDSAGDFSGAANLFNAQGSTFLAATSLGSLQTEEALSLADSWYEKIGALSGRKYLRQNSHRVIASLPGLSRGKYKAARRHPYGLTKKEQLVLIQLLSGSDNARIADELSRSKRTIENHVSSILGKFGAKSRVELILRVQAEPWIMEDHSGLK